MRVSNDSRKSRTRRSQASESDSVEESVPSVSAKRKIKRVFQDDELPLSEREKSDRNRRVPKGKIVFENITYADVELAILNSEGYISHVAATLGISVWNLRNIMMKYKQLQQDFVEFRELRLDALEQALNEKALRGDTTALIFSLKCLGKERGYVEGALKEEKKVPRVKLENANKGKKVIDERSNSRVIDFTKERESRGSGS